MDSNADGMNNDAAWCCCYVWVTTGGAVRTLLVLDDDSCPAELQACYPRGGSRFSIQMRRGGLVRVHDSVLMPNVIHHSIYHI